MHISHEAVHANYFGLPTIRSRNGDEISLANFTVLSGANALQRSGKSIVGGGVVENGALKGGKTVGTNVTTDTATGKVFVGANDINDI